MVYGQTVVLHHLRHVPPVAAMTHNHRVSRTGRPCGSEPPQEPYQRRGCSAACRAAAARRLHSLLTMLALVLLATTLMPVRAVDREVWSIYDTVETAAAAEDHPEELPPEIVYSLGFRMEELVQASDCLSSTYRISLHRVTCVMRRQPRWSSADYGGAGQC